MTIWDRSPRVGTSHEVSLSVTRGGSEVTELTKQIFARKGASRDVSGSQIAGLHPPDPERDFSANSPLPNLRAASHFLALRSNRFFLALHRNCSPIFLVRSPLSLLSHSPARLKWFSRVFLLGSTGKGFKTKNCSSAFLAFSLRPILGRSESRSSWS